jgi:hypothetical protein
MGRLVRLGTALVASLVVSLAVTGCGSHPAPSPQNAAIKTVSNYVRPLVVGNIEDFAAKRQRNGDWLVTFTGRFAEAGKSDRGLVGWCTGHGFPAGTKLQQTVDNAGRQLVSKNGENLIGKTTWHGTGATTTVECPASS